MEAYNIIFFLSGFVCVILPILWGFKKIRYKHWQKLAIHSIDSIISITKPGNYAIMIMGGDVRRIGNFSIRIFSASRDIVVTRKMMKSWFYYRGQLGTSYYKFYIPQKGDYMVTAFNYQDLVLNPSMLMLINFYQDRVASDSTYLVIRPAVPAYQIIIAAIVYHIGLFFMIAGGAGEDFWIVH